MCLGAEQAGKIFVDCTGNRPERLLLDATGCARFPVGGGSASVWVWEEIAPQRETEKPDAALPQQK